MLSALWDYALWDDCLWDTLVAEVTGGWTSDDDLWAGSIIIAPPGISKWNENPDVWTSLINITLFPPIYSAGGGFVDSFGDRLPDWRRRRKNLEEAYAHWRYTLTGRWASQDSSWSGGVVTTEVPEERLQQQIRAMFGPVEIYDEDEDLLWLM